MDFPSHTPADTDRLGHALGHAARALHAPLCIALRGGLGAGKTHLARAIATAAGIADPSLVSSPTYVLMNIYPAAPDGLTTYHLDAYRIASPDDFAAVGFDELADAPALTLIEWPERIESLLPPDHLDITLTPTDHPSHRLIHLHPTGPVSAELSTLAEDILAKNKS